MAKSGCGTQEATTEAAPGCGSSGCGGAATQREDACCGVDEQIKDAGGSGCGSAASKAATERAKGNLAAASAGPATKSCCS